MNIPGHLTSGLILDDYKLPNLRKALDEANFTTRVEVPYGKNITLVKVIHPVHRLAEITKIIQKAEIDAKRSN